MANIKHMELFMGRVGIIRDLKEIGNGNHVINFSVAETPRMKNAQGEWVDGETVWTEVDLWGDEAVSFSKSDITKGTLVIVYGTRKARSYQDDANKKIVTQRVTADFVAVPIARNVIIEKITKTVREGGYTPAPQTTQAAPKDDYSQVAPTQAAPKLEPVISEEDELFGSFSIDTDGEDDFFSNL